MKNLVDQYEENSNKLKELHKELLQLAKEKVIKATETLEDVIDTTIIIIEEGTEFLDLK